MKAIDFAHGAAVIVATRIGALSVRSQHDLLTHNETNKGLAVEREAALIACMVDDVDVARVHLENRVRVVPPKHLLAVHLCALSNALPTS